MKFVPEEIVITPNLQASDISSMYQREAFMPPSRMDAKEGLTPVFNRISLAAFTHSI